MRRVASLVCAIVAAACAAEAPEPRVNATLPIVEKPPPKTIYGVDPPVAHEATYADQLTPPPAAAGPAWGCGETSGVAGLVGLRNPMRACYEKSLGADPARAGKIVYRLEIDGTGRATRVSVGSTTLGDKQLESCLARVFERGSYPCVSGTVSVPIQLSPH